MKIPLWLLAILVLIPLSILAHEVYQLGEERGYAVRKSEESPPEPQNIVSSDSPKENDSAREWVEVTISEEKANESAVVLTEEEAGSSTQKLQYKPVRSVQ